MMINSKQIPSNNLNQIQDVFTLPRPKGNFILGNVIEFGKDALGFMTQWTQQYGDIVPLRLGNSPTPRSTNQVTARATIIPQATITLQPNNGIKVIVKQRVN